MQEIIDRWDYGLNTINPKDVPQCTCDSYYFKCPRGLHESELKHIDKIYSRKYVSYCNKCNSFEQWCIDNKKIELLSRWDYDLNNKKPNEIDYSSSLSFYFKCKDGIHKSELKYISNLIKQPGSDRCIQCCSFANWCINNIDPDFFNIYWSDKNTIDPYSIMVNSFSKVWIKCTNKQYHDDYEVSCVNFVKGRRCSYCSGKKVDYFDSLECAYPLSAELWSDKNDMQPSDFMPLSNKMAIWKCHNKKHEDFKRSISNSVVVDFRCPLCTAEKNVSSLQEKVKIYLNKSYNYTILHERYCDIIAINPKTKYPMPYDNEVKELNLIIEVHGAQHYLSSSYDYIFNNKKESSEEQLHRRRLYDRYKKYYAVSNGYHYIEIPYWTEDNNSYKSIISDKIKQITQQ